MSESDCDVYVLSTPFEYDVGIDLLERNTGTQTKGTCAKRLVVFRGTHNQPFLFALVH